MAAVGLENNTVPVFSWVKIYVNDIGVFLEWTSNIYKFTIKI